MSSTIPSVWGPPASCLTLFCGSCKMKLACSVKRLHSLEEFKGHVWPLDFWNFEKQVFLCFWISIVATLFKRSKVSGNPTCTSSNLSRRLGKQCHLRTKQPASSLHRQNTLFLWHAWSPSAQRKGVNLPYASPLGWSCLGVWLSPQCRFEC